VLLVLAVVVAVTTAAAMSQLVGLEVVALEVLVLLHMWVELLVPQIQVAVAVEHRVRTVQTLVVMVVLVLLLFATLFKEKI
jgi:hypothetical protein